MAQQAFLAAQARRYATEGEGADLQREATAVNLTGKTGDELMRALHKNKDRLKKLFDVWDAIALRIYVLAIPIIVIIRVI